MNIAILLKNIFIDRILTCSVQYIRYENNNVYSFVLLTYWLKTKINLLKREISVCCLYSK